MSNAPPRVSGIEYLANLSHDRATSEAAIARRLLGEFRPYLRLLVILLVFNLITAACQAVAPWLISRAIDRNIISGDTSGLTLTMLLLLAVYIVEALVTRGQLFRITAIGHEILASFRQRVFEQYLNLPIGNLNKKRMGDLISRAISDVSTLNSIFTQSVAFLPGYLLSLIGTLTAMLILSPRLAVAAFIVVPLMYLSDAYFAAQARKAFREVRRETGDVTARLEEEIASVREAQAFNRVQTNIGRFRDRIIGFRNANLHAVSVTSATAPTFDILNTLGTAIVIGYGAYLVINGSLTTGVLAAFILYVQQFYRPIQMLSQVRTQVQSSLAASERIYSVLDEQREPEDAPDTIVLDEVKGVIEFDNVSFAYEAGNPVLHNISFCIDPGQTVALVGPTGAGKTTIANLIARFYDPQEGTVRIDGYDVKRVSLKSLRSKMAVVHQEPFLFSGTIEENIGYARQEYSRAEIEWAAQMAGLHDFIEALPSGYETKLGQRGKPLSRGQCQLISIARAVLADPRILILDEAMATVDARAEAAVQSAMERLLEGRTCLVIAHRLSTIRNSDLVLVIADGRIVERGDQESLLDRGGPYFHLFRGQFQDHRGEIQTAPASRRSLEGHYRIE